MVTGRYSLALIACLLLTLSPTSVASAQPPLPKKLPKKPAGMLAPPRPTADALPADVSAQIDRLLSDESVDKPAAAKALSRFLDAAPAAIRWRAARVIGKLQISSPEIIEKLQHGAADKDWIVQVHSMAALARLGDKSDATLEVLMQGATSSNGRVAVAAINSLKHLKIDPSKVAKALNSGLTGETKGVATYVVEAMVQAGSKSVPLLKEALKEPKSAYWACIAIAEIGPDAADTLPDIIAFLQRNEHMEEVSPALLALAAIGPEAKSAEKVVADIVGASTDSTVQLTGMYTLGVIGATESEATLRKGTESSDPFVSMVASWALAKTKLGDHAVLEAAITQLVAGLKSDNPRMRQAAAKGLSTLDIPAGMVAPHLLAAAKDPASRKHIIDALASLGEEIVPKAAQALEDPETRLLGIEVLGRLGPKAAGATPALIACLKDCDSAACERIAFVLAEIGPAAAAATEQLAAGLASEETPIRQSSLYALREIGTAAIAAKPALLKMVHATDDDSSEAAFEKKAAAWALARIAPNDATVIEAIAPVLVEGLQSKSDLVRLESLTAAVEISSATNRPLGKMILHMSENDPAPMVREAAKAALSTKD